MLKNTVIVLYRQEIPLSEGIDFPKIILQFITIPITILVKIREKLQKLMIKFI